jgi:hypothetical protein
MSILLETLYETKEKSFEEKIGIEESFDEYDELSAIGTSLLFLKENYRDCINLFGAKVTSELLEEANTTYKNIITESILSNNAPAPAPAIDFKAIWDTIKDNGTAIAAGTLAAIVIAGAYKAYRNYFSKAAKACKGKKGEEKEACMVNYKENAYRLQQQVLKKSLSLANKSEKPSEFKKKIEIYMQKIKK